MFFLFISSIISCGREKNTDSKKNRIISNIGFDQNGNMEIDKQEFYPIMLNGIHHDSIALTEFLSKGVKMILLITDRCCQDCVRKELERISKFQSPDNVSKLAIFMSYQNPRQQYAFVQLYKLKYQVFNVYDKKLSPNIIFLDLPLYFLIDQLLHFQDALYVSADQSQVIIDQYIQKELASITH